MKFSASFPSLKTLAIALAVLNLLDLVMTFLAVKLGGTELNSFAGFLLNGFWGYILVKLIGSIGIVFVVYRLKFVNVARYVIFPVLVVYSAVAVNNFIWLVVR